MPNKVDTTNVSPKLPDYVRAAVFTLASFIDTGAARPGSQADGARYRVHELIAALNKLA